jgi:methanogenic corrinoid protein MtbC1
MAQVGELCEEGEIFAPEMLVAARAMTAALTVLRSLRIITRSVVVR